jgi:hypothetical protein
MTPIATFESFHPSNTRKRYRYSSDLYEQDGITEGMRLAPGFPGLDFHRECNVQGLVQKSKAPRLVVPCKVHFSEPMSSIKLIDTSSYDKKTTWYSGRELKKHLNEQRALVTTMRQQNPPKQYTTEECRGLEDLLSIKNMAERRFRLVTTIRSVLEEQERQKDMGMIDPVRLRQRSLRASHRSQERAFQRANSHYHNKVII